MSLEAAQKRILVVDDEPLVLKYISSILRRMGCREVYEAESAEQGTEFIEKHDIGLLISDITLPDGDGRRLATTLLENKPDAGVVLITGFSMSDIMLSSEIRDRVMLLEKPFTPDDVSAVLGKHFKEVTLPAALPPRKGAVVAAMQAAA